MFFEEEIIEDTILQGWYNAVITNISWAKYQYERMIRIEWELCTQEDKKISQNIKLNSQLRDTVKRARKMFQKLDEATEGVYAEEFKKDKNINNSEHLKVLFNRVAAIKIKYVDKGDYSFVEDIAKFDFENR